MIQNMSIDQLLPLCTEQNERAQLEVYQRYHLAMYHSALRIVRNPVDAEDLMHEGFLTAFEKLNQYKGENKFGGWLKQIILRKAFNFVKQKEKNTHYTINEAIIPEITVEKNEEDKAQIKQLQQALNQLKARYRNVLILMYFEGYDYEEISDILNLSYGNCRIKIKVPLAALKSAQLSGSGKIHSQETIQSNRLNTSLSGSGKIILNVATQNLNSQLSGSGKIQLKGEAQKVATKLSGSGSIRLQEVQAKDAEATLVGSGSIYLSCSNDLEATIAGSGRIRYFGEPAGKIHTKVAGSGSIRLAKE